MSAPSKKRGTAFESRVCKYLRSWSGDDRIERRALHGSRDMGDLYGLHAYQMEGIVECKSYNTYPTQPRMLQAFKEQTEAERGNADADFALLVVRVPQRAIAMADCYVTYRTLDLMLGTYSPTTDYEKFEDPWVCMHLWQMCLLMWGEYENGE